MGRINRRRFNWFLIGVCIWLLLVLGCRHDVTLIEHTPPPPILVPTTLPSSELVLCRDNNLEWAKIAAYQATKERYNRFILVVAPGLVKNENWFADYGGLEVPLKTFEDFEWQYPNFDIILFVDNPAGFGKLRGSNRLHYFKSDVFDHENKRLKVNIWDIVEATR